MKVVVLLVVSLVIVLLAQFALEPLADRNDLVHWMQHGLLFWAGIGVGASLVLLYRQGQRRV